MTEDYLNAWQCIGCGRIEAPQTHGCSCQDRRVQFVYAKDYEAALIRAEASERALELVRKLASVTPKAENFRQKLYSLRCSARRGGSWRGRKARPPKQPRPNRTRMSKGPAMSWNSVCRANRRNFCAFKGAAILSRGFRVSFFVAAV